MVFYIMSVHQTNKLVDSIGLSFEPKKKIKKKESSGYSTEVQTFHLCVICCLQATEISPSRRLQTKFLNCKLGYLTDGNQMRHNDNDKAICRTCRYKLKAQQIKFPNIKDNHCPFCRSHNPLAKQPISCRMPRKKKPFAEAEIIRMRKLNNKLKREKMIRKQLYGYFYEDDIMKEKKFRPLKIYKEKGRMKMINERILRNKIRTPKRRK